MENISFFIWLFFRAAFFHAQIEQPARGLMSLFSARDVDVLVGINERGIFVIDQNNNVSFVDAIVMI